MINAKCFFHIPVFNPKRKTAMKKNTRKPLKSTAAAKPHALERHQYRGKGLQPGETDCRA
jgi:hypothetical protein